jgi:hypothetical protein
LDGREVIMQLQFNISSPGTLPTSISSTIMPCLWEPVLHVPSGRSSKSRAAPPKQGRRLIQILTSRLGPRYAQMRCMSTEFASILDVARMEQSLTGAILQLLYLENDLFRQLVPLVCQIVRQSLASPRAEFYPIGSLYCCWLVGRLMLVEPARNANARELAVRLRTWVLGADRAERLEP